jgi:hypothetical protein
MYDIQWCAFEIRQQIFSQTFWLFQPPSKYNSETNDTSLESPYIELFETEIKLGMAAFIKGCHAHFKKSNTFSKTSLAPPIGIFSQFLFQVCFTTTQGFKKRYITLF